MGLRIFNSTLERPPTRKKGEGRPFPTEPKEGKRETRSEETLVKGRTKETSGSDRCHSSVKHTPKAGQGPRPPPKDSS